MRTLYLVTAGLTILLILLLAAQQGSENYRQHRLTDCLKHNPITTCRP